LNIFKNYAIYLPLEHQTTFLEYMMLDAPPNTVNLRMLTRIFQIIAKIQFNKLRTETNLTTPAGSQLQNLAINLQQKLKVAFGDAH
jgi:hypothetical protein